jgi:nickel-dependent lactate racemase
MNLDLPYLDRQLHLRIPDENLLAVIEPNEIGEAGEAGTLIAEALASPLGPDGRAGGRGLHEFLAGAASLLVIVNDATRPTPTATMLEALSPWFGRMDVRIIVATGAHRGPTEDEYRQILGAGYEGLRRLCGAHSARDEASLVDLGKTSRGTPVILNRAVLEADRIIVTGSVEPHYFAGYTGGRKAFLPGLAAFRSIEANHRFALDPRAASLSLDANPVHLDMMEALPLVKAPVFSIMTVLDREQRPAAVTAGDLAGAFNSAVGIARRIFCVPLTERADLVISVAKFPMDIDLYQSQKAIENGALALVDGGTLLLVSSCRDGIGDKTFAELLARADSPGRVLDMMRTGYRLGYHKAAKIAELAGRARILARTELGSAILGPLFIEAVTDLQAAVDAAIASATAAKGRPAKVLVLPDGSLTVPLIEVSRT